MHLLLVMLLLRQGLVGGSALRLHAGTGAYADVGLGNIITHGAQIIATAAVLLHGRRPLHNLADCLHLLKQHLGKLLLRVRRLLSVRVLDLIIELVGIGHGYLNIGHDVSHLLLMHHLFLQLLLARRPLMALPCLALCLQFQFVVLQVFCFQNLLQLRDFLVRRH
jgi:hypothetical protein